MELLEYVEHVVFLNRSNVVKYFKEHYPDYTDVDVDDALAILFHNTGIQPWNLLTKEKVSDVLTSTLEDHGEAYITIGNILADINSDVEYINVIRHEVGLKPLTIVDFQHDEVLEQVLQLHKDL